MDIAAFPLHYKNLVLACQTAGEGKKVYFCKNDSAKKDKILGISEGVCIKIENK